MEADVEATSTHTSTHTSTRMGTRSEVVEVVTRGERCRMGTVKLSSSGRPSWQAEGDAGPALKPRRQPR